jgi:hypothetical protein
MKIPTLKVKKFMKANRKNHVDPLTGECDCTALAEETAIEFDLYEDKVTWKIPDELFDIALDYL